MNRSEAITEFIKELRNDPAAQERLAKVAVSLYEDREILLKALEKTLTPRERQQLDREIRLEKARKGLALEEHLQIHKAFANRTTLGSEDEE